MVMGIGGTVVLIVFILAALLSVVLYFSTDIKELFFLIIFFLLLSLIGVIFEPHINRGTVLTERDLNEGQVYEVLFSSENTVEGGYLVVAEELGRKNGQERRPRVYLLPVKPKTSFSVSFTNGMIKYSDAAEVR